MNQKETEEDFLKKYDSSRYEKPSVSIDLLLCTVQEDELKVLLVPRKEYPFAGQLSLPGTFVGIKESLENAVERCLLQKTGLSKLYFEQLYTFGLPDRDPRMRIISVAYLALVSADQLHRAGTMTGTLYSVRELLRKQEKLAFDHLEMIRCAESRIRNKAEYTAIPFSFLPETFTLSQLQHVYEILLGKPLYKANFRKKIKNMVLETNQMTSGAAHRPSKLYKENKAWNMEEIL